MLRQILAVAAFAGAFGTAQGQLVENIQQGAEVPLAELDLPAGPGGLLRFAVCEGCESHSIVMPGDTRYILNHKAATFEELVAAVETAQSSSSIAERSIVGLYFETATKRLVRIAVVAPIPPQQ